jgi:hypothetical protein
MHCKIEMTFHVLGSPRYICRPYPIIIEIIASTHLPFPLQASLQRGPVYVIRERKFVACHELRNINCDHRHTSLRTPSSRDLTSSVGHLRHVSDLGCHRRRYETRLFAHKMAREWNLPSSSSPTLYDDGQTLGACLDRSGETAL